MLQMNISRDDRLPTCLDNITISQNRVGSDYLLFNFVNLFSKVLKKKTFNAFSKTQPKVLVARFEHKLSEHMPL